MSKMKVFYDPRMVADSGGYSPSAGKPRALVESWLEGPMAPYVEVASFAAATEQELSAAHDPEYVRGVLDGTEQNGFGNRRTDVALSLPWTSGATAAAARFALFNPKAPPSCAPTSGFHHARYNRGGGFCTFNGLMVAALSILRDYPNARVGILDADMHYGDGTDDVIEQLNRRFFWPNGRRDHIQHVTFGRSYARPDQAMRFFDELPLVVARMARAVDVVIYQAGADPHVDDPLGGWLTTEQLAERDAIVFEVCRTFNVGVAWNLAGGYSRNREGEIPTVLTIHTNTARAALAAAGCL